MKKAILVATTVALALTGCASTNTGIVQISEGTYMYAKQDWAAYSGGAVKAELHKEANAFCAGKGKKFAPINSTSQDAIAYHASAGAEIQFTCK